MHLLNSQKPEKAPKRKAQDDPSKLTVATKKKKKNTAESSNKRKAGDVVESDKSNKKVRALENCLQCCLIDTRIRRSSTLGKPNLLKHPTHSNPSPQRLSKNRQRSVLCPGKISLHAVLLPCATIHFRRLQCSNSLNCLTRPTTSRQKAVLKQKVSTLSISRFVRPSQKKNDARPLLSSDLGDNGPQHSTMKICASEFSTCRKSSWTFLSIPPNCRLVLFGTIF